MYTKFFRLAQAPFSISPDPRYLFMSERHREALAHLLYGVDAGGGVVLLTGDIGTGKTTICRCFLEQVPANCNVAYIFNPKLTVAELLQSVCEEFHIEPAIRHGAGVKEYIDALNRFLLTAHADGRNNVLVIDEAQNLSADVLEQLRLLTNLETNERKLLQIILIGQPELRAMLARPELEQLAQRVIAHYHLTALSEQETASYIQHRMATAGLTAASPFQQPLMKQIHRLTGGVPRRINLLCDRALLGAYAQGAQQVDSRTVDEAASELFINLRAPRPAPARRWPAFAAVGLGAAVIAAGWAWNGESVLRKMHAALTSQHDPVPAQTAPAAQATQAAAPAKPDDPPLRPAQPAPATQEKPAPEQRILAENNGATRAGLRDERDAVRRLWALWGETAPSGDPCAPAQSDTLRCHRSNGGIAELRQLDRPAVLTLYDQANKPFYVLMTGLGENSLTLRVGDITQEVSLLHLVRHFRSEFVTLWRAPSGFDVAVEEKDKGPAADWFAAELAKLNRVKPPAPGEPLGAKTLKQVKQFQQALGLYVDGVIGPVTAMHINRAAGLAEPRLDKRTEPERRVE
ncbi:MAG TPA: AAA family ATPase [Noviherbaspirillum sp.]|uniref:AAA family ATPase n=1 Tax=Noviherbaspirillum sp. TaxID=1926288 RepID=UPI002D764636|nr:AAA family ATPase [Noviherbaspirillum sp.]HYD94819.1 AAA family ATPase [Noviherbaspirillum sp.]